MNVDCYGDEAFKTATTCCRIIPLCTFVHLLMMNDHVLLAKNKDNGGIGHMMGLKQLG